MVVNIGGRKISWPPGVRKYLESLFGEDFLTVHLYESDEPKRWQARAFAFGEDIVFGPGELDFETFEGRKLLGHELAHVVQQRFGCTNQSSSGELQDPYLEYEADLAGLQIALGLPVVIQKPAHHVSRKPEKIIQCVKLKINSNEGEISSIRLLRILNECSKGLQNVGPKPPLLGTRLFEFTDIVERQKIANNAYAPVYELTFAKQWYWFAGRLHRGENSALPCVVRILGLDVCITSSERVLFPISAYKKDLNYKNIADGFDTYLSGMDDQNIASFILDAMMNKHVPLAGDALGFIAGLTVLLFGVESSRFPTGLCTTLFYLDLVLHRKTYGRSGKPFTLRGAFHSNKNWDHLNAYGTPAWYGGKYPYATHETGVGNRVMYEQLVAGLHDGNERILQLSQRHAVPRREVTLFIHWLEANYSDDELRNLYPLKIEVTLLERTNAAYIHCQPYQLAHNPRPNTGTAAAGGPKIGPFQSSAMQVYWFDGGIYYHRSLECSLIPGHFRAQGRPLYKEDYERSALFFQEMHQKTAKDFLISSRNRALAAIKNVDTKIGNCWQGQPFVAAYQYRKHPCPKCRP